MKKYTIDDLAEGVKGVEEVQQLMDKLVEYIKKNKKKKGPSLFCLLYTSDAADE